MKPLFATAAPAETAASEKALLISMGIDYTQRVFSDYSCREINAMHRLRQQRRDACITRFLCASRDAEDAVDYRTGDLSPEFDTVRYERCEFYRSEVDHWQSYWRKAV